MFISGDFELVVESLVARRVLNKTVRKRASQILPWVFTGIGIYFAFNDIDWGLVTAHIGDVRWSLVGLAAVLTCLSYLLRSRRWQYLFPTKILSFVNSARVLFLGFFMNNILPARAGEFVRAHLGARTTNETRTLVLATIASERLADGVTISLMFVVFSLGLADAETSNALLYVSSVFGVAVIGVILTILLRTQLFQFAAKVLGKFDNRASAYTLDRLQVFINGLSPLASIRRLPSLVLWSVVIWGVELCVYICVVKAFNASLNLPACVLFLVAVNFSSLIPAAPGGIGVIEAVASAVLVSIGLARELALPMVICQHAIQYTVVFFPGVYVMFTWKKQIAQIRALTDE